MGMFAYVVMNSQHDSGWWNSRDLFAGFCQDVDTLQVQAKPRVRQQTLFDKPLKPTKEYIAGACVSKWEDDRVQDSIATTQLNKNSPFIFFKFLNFKVLSPIKASFIIPVPEQVSHNLQYKTNTHQNDLMQEIQPILVEFTFRYRCLRLQPKCLIELIDTSYWQADFSCCTSPVLSDKQV